MKLSITSFFRKTKNSAPAEARDSLPQFSLGFRAMAFLTASVIFLQGPLAIAADSIWLGAGANNSWSTLANWQFGVIPTTSAIFFPKVGTPTIVDLGTSSRAVRDLSIQDSSDVGASSISIGSTGGYVLRIGDSGIGFTASDSGNQRTLNLNSGVNLVATQSWNVDGVNDTVSVAGVVSGSLASGLVKIGQGALILSGSNSFAGGLAIDSGVVRLNVSGTSSASSAAGVGLLTINGGSLDNTSGSTVTLATNNLQSWNGNFTYLGTGGSVLNVGTGDVTLGANRTVTVNAGILAVGGAIGGTYSLTKAGAGQLTLSGANTFSEGLTLSEGQLNLNSGAAAGAGTLTIQGGVVDNTSGSQVTLTNAAQIWNGSFTFLGSNDLNTGAATITLNAGSQTITAGTLAIGGAISGTGSILKQGVGTLAIDAAATYTGSTTVAQGTLRTSGDDYLPTATDVAIASGATLQLGGLQTIATISGAGKLVKAGDLTISSGSGNTFSGVLSGTGTLTLATGTLTLSGVNTYTGETVLNAGALLRLGNDRALGGTADSVTVNAGAALDLGGKSVGANRVYLDGTGVVESGALFNSSSLASLAGQVVLAGSSSIGGTGDIRLLGGIVEDITAANFTKTGTGVLSLAGSSAFTGTTTVAGGALQLDNANALGDGTNNTSGVVVSAGAALDLNGITSAVNVPLSLSGTGNLNTGALTNSGAAASFGGTITLEDHSSIRGGITLSGDILGAKTLTKVKAGSLVLTGANNAAASFVVDEGALAIGNGSITGTLGSGSVEIKGATSLIFNRTDDYSGPVNNILSGAGNVTVASGTLTLGGTNTYTGATQLLSGGTLILGSNGALDSSNGVSIATGALLDLNGKESTVSLTLDGQSDTAAVLVNNNGGPALHSGSVLLLGTSAIGGVGDLTLSGVVSGGTLSKVGDSILSLAGANTYDQTLISSGTLKLVSGGSLGSGAVQNDAQLVFGRTIASTVANSISGAGVVFVDAGTVTLTGANTYSGATTVLTGATLSIGNGGTTGSLASSIALTPGSFVNFNRSDDTVYGGTLSGAGTFTKLGAGILGLFNDNDLSPAGTILVSEGVLAIGTGGAVGSLAGDITNNAAIQFNRTGALAYNGTISGTGSVSNIGAGEVTLAGTQTYSGATSIAAGTVNAGTLSNTVSISLTGGALNVASFNAAAALSLSNVATVNVLDADLTLSGNILNNAGIGGGLNFTASSGTTTLVGGLAGTGVTSFGSHATISGTLLAGSVDVLGLLTATDISGGTISAVSLLSSGTVRGGAITVSAGSALLGRVSGGVLELQGATNTVTELLGGTFNLTHSAPTLTVAGGIQEVTGSISGNANLISTGTLTLNGVNSYSGGTNVTSGSLFVGNISSLGSGSLTLADATSFGAIANGPSGVGINNSLVLGGSVAFVGENDLSIAGPVTLSTGTALIDVAGGDMSHRRLTLEGAITGGNLTKEGIGELELNGVGSDISLTVSRGGVVVGEGALSSTGRVTVGDSGAFRLQGNQSFASLSGMRMGLVLLQSNSLTLSEGGLYRGQIEGFSNSYLNLAGGTFTVDEFSLGNGFEGTVNVTAGTLDLGGFEQRVGSAILNGGTIQNGRLNFLNLTLSSGNYAADLTGSGEVVKDTTAGTVLLNGNNTAFTGNIRLQGGTLDIGPSGTAVGASNAIIFDATAASPTLNLSTDTTVASLSGGALAGGSQGLINIHTYDLVLGGAGTATYSGSMTANGGAAIIKNGSGTQVLAGDATGAVFNNGITINEGILEIANPLALGSTANPIYLTGGTLSLSAGELLAARHTLEVTAQSSLVLGGTPFQELGALTLVGTLDVTATAGATSSTVQDIAFFGTTTLTGTSTLSVGSFASVAVGAISGSFDFTKAGAGALTLTGANDSTAQTFVTGGSLVLGASGSLASGSLSVEGLTTVLDLGGTTQTVGGVSISEATVQFGTLSGTGFTLADAAVSARLTGSGALTSSGLTTLSGQNDYLGVTTVNGGSLNIATTGSLRADGNLIVSLGAYANFLGTTVTLGSISGLGTTVFAGTANVAQDLAEGVINIAGDAALRSITGATVTVEQAAVLSVGLASGSLTLNGTGSQLGTISGGSLQLNAGADALAVGFTDGTVALAGSLGIVGHTNVFAGTLAGSGTLAIGDGNQTMSGTATLFTGTLKVVDGSGLLIDTAMNAAASLLISGSSGAWIKTNGGTIGSVSVSSDSAFVLGQGTYTLSPSLATTDPIVAGGGTFNIGSLSGAGVVANVVQSPSVLSVGALNTTTVFSGTLTQDGASSAAPLSLVKVGTGTLTLTGVNEYAGTTTVAGGYLVAGNALALSGGLVTVTAGGALGLSGDIALNNAIVLSGTEGDGALVNIDGNNALTGLVTLAGDSKLSVLSGALATGSINGSASNLSVNGNLTVQGTISLGATNTLESTSGNLTLNGAVTAGTVKVSGGVASVNADLTARLDLDGLATVELLRNLSVSSLSSSADTTLNLGANGLTVVDGSGLTAAGSIFGSGSLTLGSGSLTLAGVNTYEGGTTITSGFLDVIGSLAPNSALTISTAAGTAQFLNPTLLGDVANEGLLRFLSTAQMGTLTGNGTIEFAGGVTAGDITGGSLTIAKSDTSAVNTLGALSGVNLTVTEDTAVTASSFAGAIATVAGTLSITGELTGGQLSNGGVISVGTLTAGEIQSAAGSLLNVAGGVFTGTISGSGAVNTTGAFSIALEATLDSLLSYTVSETGVLTLVSVRSLGALINDGSVSFSANGGVDVLGGTGNTSFAADATLRTVTGGSVTVVGVTTLLGTLSGGVLTAGSLFTGGTGGTLTEDGRLDLNVSGNTLQTVSGGTLNVNVNATTTVDLLSGGLVQNDALLTVGTLNGGTVTNSNVLNVFGGNFINGTLVGDGSLNVNGNLTLAGTQDEFTGAIRVSSGTTLTVSTALSTQNNITVDTLGRAFFTPVSILQSLANAGSVTFQSETTVVELTGNGSTTFEHNAILPGGVSVGVVDIQGSSQIGNVTGGVLTLRSSENLLESVSGGADVTILGVADVFRLDSGTVTNSGRLNVIGGSFTGSLSGAGTVNATGAFTIESSAILGSALNYGVGDNGALTFAGTSRTIRTLENYGTVTFSNGGGWTSSQTGSGTVTVASGTLNATNGTGALVVGSLATALYTAGVTLDNLENRGTLTLETGGTVNTIDSTGSLTHGGTLTISGAGSITSLTGTTATTLTKSGSGTLTLGGTYLGQTQVTGGTLSLNSGALLSGDVTVEGGRLLLGGTNQFGGNLTLKSGMVDLGGHAQILVGSSTFAASGGIFGEVAEAGSLTASRLNITGGTLNAGVLFSGGGTLSGTLSLPVISVSGSTEPVSFAGTGALVTTGTVFAPSVTLGGSYNTLVLTGSSSSAAPQTGTLTISGSNNTVEFTQGFAPAGNLVLTVGDATSAGGSLKVGLKEDGAGLVLGGSQTLMGRGTIVGDVTFGNGSTVAPGNSPGTIKVVGSSTFNGGTLLIQFDRSYVGSGTLAQDRYSAGGLVTINGGTLILDLGTGATRFRPGTDTLLPIFIDTDNNALTTSGSGFASIIAPAGLGVSFNAGTISFTAAGFSKVNGVTGNVSAVGALVDASMRDGTDTGSFRALIDNGGLGSTSAATVAATLAALDPGVYADLGNIGLDRLRDVQAGLSNHLDMLALDAVGESSLSLAVKPGQSAAAAAVEQSRAWTTAYGGWGKRSSDSAVGAAGYSSSNYGDISGVETKVGALTIGITGALGTSTANFENGKGKLTSDSWHTGVYGSLPAGAVVLDASFAYGQSDSTLKRSVNVAGGGATSGKSQGSEWTGQIGLAVPFRADDGSLVLTPSLHLLHSSVKQDTLTESSLNGLEAVVKGRTTESTAIRTGVQAAKLTKLAGKATRLTASLDWVHSFDSDRKDVEIALSGAGTATSRFQGSKGGQDAIRIGLGGEFTLTERTRFRLNVDQQIKSGVNSTYGSASFGVQF